MQFYRRLKPFKAISFDLDDTLYHNTPVMRATDAKMVEYFTQVLPPLASGQYDFNYWFEYRKQALATSPELKHDVAALRLKSYLLGISALGLTQASALSLATDALEYFVEQRSDFLVPQSTHQLLAELKQHWPIIAISNGNVDTQAIGIADYFSAIYHAGNGIKQKPDVEMFKLTCQQFSLKPEELLHIGDCGANDIVGAIRMGCQTAWVSTYDVGKPIHVLPSFELTDVTELHRLLPND